MNSETRYTPRSDILIAIGEGVREGGLGLRRTTGLYLSYLKEKQTWQDVDVCPFWVVDA